MEPTVVTVEDVRNFWEKNPLWAGESRFSPGTKDFFEEHRQVVINDCMAGLLDTRYLPQNSQRTKVLDLGCGPGFWTIELNKLGCKEVVSADLTERALELTKSRCAIYNYPFKGSLQNAEALTFEDGTFSHVNCQGVIHHTPNTLRCIQEISRVLEKGGTASISVYYKNILLKAWPLLSVIVRKLGLTPKLSGRGRENIGQNDDINEIVRLYDGVENPLGKAYSLNEFKEMVAPFFEIKEHFYHFFPARALPFKVPKLIHRLLDNYFGFMLVLSLKKRSSECFRN